MQIGDRIAELGVSHVHAGGADHLGVWRGKRVAAGTAARGPDRILRRRLRTRHRRRVGGAARADTPGWYPSSDAGYPDMLLALDEATAVACPWLGGEGWVLGDWLLPDGSPLPLCPRGALRRVLAELATPRPRAARPPSSSSATSCPPTERCTSARTRITACAPRSTATSSTRSSRRSRAPALRVEAANFENGIGQLELNVAYRDALGAADEAFLAKQAIRVAAAGLRAARIVHGAALRRGARQLRPRPPVALARRREPAGDEATATPSPACARRCPRRSRCACRSPTATRGCSATRWRRPPARGRRRTARSRCAPSAHDGAINRIEHRLPGADCNPYDALAALVAGILTGLDDASRAAAGHRGQHATSCPTSSSCRDAGRGRRGAARGHRAHGDARRRPGRAPLRDARGRGGGGPRPGLGRGPPAVLRARVGGYCDFT